MSKNNIKDLKSDNKTYIKVIDVALAQKNNKKQVTGAVFSEALILLLILVVSSAISIVVFGLIVGVLIAGIVLIIGGLVLMLKLSKLNSKAIDYSGDDYSKQSVDAKDYYRLKKILEKSGAIVMSHCDGKVLTPSEKDAMFLAPALYATTSIRPGEETVLFMVSNDLSALSESDKKLVKKILKQGQNDEVIWFKQKDISTLNAFSRIRLIPFINNDGKKMYFAHGSFSPLKDQAQLELADNECVIYTKDKHRR